MLSHRPDRREIEQKETKVTKKGKLEIGVGSLPSDGADALAAGYLLPPFRPHRFFSRRVPGALPRAEEFRAVGAQLQARRAVIP